MAVGCTSRGSGGLQEFLETLVLHDAALLGLYSLVRSPGMEWDGGRGGRGVGASFRPPVMVGGKGC